MYLKLMVRGLLRHRRSGKRLFVLLALCSAAVLFFLGFRTSFGQRYQQLGIDLSTSHLQIVPSDSPKLAEDGNCTDHRQGLVLVDYSEELERFLRSLPRLESAMLAVETKGSVYTMEGEGVGSAVTLVGVDPQTFERTLPGVRVLEGSPGLAWNKSMPDIPVFRPKPALGEVVKDNDRFVRENFRPRNQEWESFKQRLAREMPVLFQGVTGAISDEAFLTSLDNALGRADLPQALPRTPSEKYDYHIDDALAALDAASPAASPGAAADASTALGSTSHLRVLRKRLLQAVYPDAIRPVRDAITLDFPYTLAIPPARGDDPVEGPYVLPIKLAAYVERMPIFNSSYYIDARALRDRLGLKEREGTNIYIRLSSAADVPAAKKTIEAWLSAHGLPYVVRDYSELGKLFSSVAMGFNSILLILVVLFVAIVMVFIVNSTLLAVAKRRREIGTSIAIGLSPRGNMLVLLGESLVLVLVSWAAGSIIGSGLLVLFHHSGVPGIIFMPGNRLLLDFHPLQLVASFLILFVTSGIAAIIPLRRLAGVKPVDLLKEAD